MTAQPNDAKQLPNDYKFHQNSKKVIPCSMLHAYSFYETKTWLQKANNRGLITNEYHSALQNEIQTIAIKLNRYINTIGKKMPTDGRSQMTSDRRSPNDGEAK